MAFSWGYGGDNYVYFELVSAEDIRGETAIMKLLLNESYNPTEDQ